MSEHTEGPWEVRDNGIGDFVISTVSKVNENIADLPACVRSHQEENKANAHLIAAAPEMLAELEDLVKYFDDEGMDEKGLKKLIAKARGRDGS